MKSSWLALLAVGISAAASAQLRGGVEYDAPSEGSVLRQSDRIFPITQTADTMPTMSGRVGTVDQLETLQGSGGGFAADVFGELAPLSWLTLGATANYGTFGDVANQVSPTAYLRGQFLSALRAGVDAAAELQYKKQGFNGADGEIESMLLVSRQLGRLSLAFNGVYGKSYTAPDADAEAKLALGYDLLPNLMVGADSLSRLDVSLDGGPRTGTRPWELTAGPTIALKLGHFTANALVGAYAPMYLPGWGETAMLTLAYGD